MNEIFVLVDYKKFYLVIGFKLEGLSIFINYFFNIEFFEKMRSNVKWYYFVVDIVIDEI